MSYCRQNPTLWPGQSLSSPIIIVPYGGDFFTPLMEQFVGSISTYTYVWIRLTLTRGGGGWRPFLHLHVKWMSSSFVAFLSVKTINCFFEILNYFPQKRTLWRGQSLSSPIRRRFSDPPNAANRWMQQCARFLWCFMLFVRHLFALFHSPLDIAADGFRASVSTWKSYGRPQRLTPSVWGK